MTDGIRVVIGTHDRHWYIDALLAVCLRMLAPRQICISDDCSAHPGMIEALDRAEDSGIHVIRWGEHTYLDPTWNRGIRWARQDGAEFIIAAEDGIIPAVNVFEELTTVLCDHDSFWIAHPILSGGPEHQLGKPEPDLSGLPVGQPLPNDCSVSAIGDDGRPTHGAIFTPDQAVAISDEMAGRCKQRCPRWRTTFDADWPLWAMKRKCWETIGFLDEAFRQGWGTNSDYCRRVIEAGGENVICERAFVFHHRDMYFDLPTKQEWMGMGQAVISARSPRAPNWIAREGDD